MSGKLYICSTPIGNLGDVTLRVLDVLKTVDVVYSEDTRITKRLLSHYEIEKPIYRCDENVLKAKLPEIIDRLNKGEQIAFATDAGTPAISDPGSRLVDAVREVGLSVEVLPGPSALTAAIAGSGFDSAAVYFGSFLPRKSGQRQTLFSKLENLKALLVFYESNKRTISSLKDIALSFPSRRVCLARELTKIHEEFVIGTAQEILDELSTRAGELKGEVVLLIEYPKRKKSDDKSDIF